MVDLLTFFHGTLGHQVPQEARAWLFEHVDPDVAIERAHAVHLLWLSSLCEEQTSREVVNVCFGRLATRSSYLDTQREPQDPEAGAELAQASGRLREALQGTRWWAALVERWEARQSRGLGVARYELHGVHTERVRGTRVGRFAVRELPWAGAARGRPPALRYREATPWNTRNRVEPQWLYAVDLVETGQSLGTFASAAVAFEVAERFDRRGVVSRPVPAPLQRVLDEHRGDPPHVEARSWPAEPHWSFAACRRRVLGWGGGDHPDRGGGLDEPGGGGGLPDRGGDLDGPDGGQGLGDAVPLRAELEHGALDVTDTLACQWSVLPRRGHGSHDGRQP